MMQRVSPLSTMICSQEVSSKARALRNRLIKKVGTFAAVLVVCALFCVWSRIRIVQMGYEVTALQKEEEGLAKRGAHLGLEVERLKSPNHLQKVAVDVLGMHPPSGEEIVFVKSTDGR